MSDNQPDWDLIAEKFDIWVPYIAPVGETLIKALDARDGMDILDVACGTGEPGLTLARTLPDATLTGTDAADGMVRAATGKAARERLSNISFKTMSAERMTFPDASFDRVICRFGVMLFEDPLAGLGEIWRVLKPGGRFAIAVWGEASTQSSFRISAEVLDPHLPDDNKTPFGKVTSLGPPGVLEAALESAGFGPFTIERHELTYTFPDFDTYWNLVEESAILKQQFDALPKSKRKTVRDEIAHLVHAYHKENQLVLPHTYLVASGNR